MSRSVSARSTAAVGSAGHESFAAQLAALPPSYAASITDLAMPGLMM
jgi:hypothetical protein